MFRIRTIAVFGMVAALVACATPPQRNYASTVKHSYSVSAIDFNGKPIPGVDVKVTVDAMGDPIKTQECKTDEQGRCALWGYQVSIVFHESNAKAVATKDGYYTTKGSASSTASYDQYKEIKLEMLRPVDFLEEEFANSNADRELRERVLRFLDVIRLQSILNEGEVMIRGIGTSEFKGKKYLRVKINSTTTYNSLKLDKYAVGKRLFDETVRKVLTPLNDAVAAPKAYAGYDIVVYGHSRSFAEKDETPSKLEYRYLMPESVVRRYKDKDITGQALLDASVLLLEDERIDLKLQ
ncbi:hypothetical protein [Ramlibacter sp. AN1133]|uniref:hypothetical protein n=1 Tax=Ramlibacter sp. AN1133 TaxID=3133429 RepID=UPI0030BE4BF2